MKHLFPLLLLIVNLALASCSKEAEPTGTGLEGHWKLTSRQCFCPNTPVPNEMAVFTATEFSFYENGHLLASGTYTNALGSFCGSKNLEPVLHLTYTSGGNTPRDVASSVAGNTLTLDYGSPCDAPRDTYQRLP